MRRVSIAALRRIVIDAQGYASRARSGVDRRGGDGDSPALVRSARLDLGRRAEPPHRARVAGRRLPSDRGLPALAAGTGVRVLGPRGVPDPRRGLAALRRRRCIREAGGGTGTSARRIHISRTRSWPRSRARGALASRHFDGTSEGGMWNWKPAKAMLDRLWNHGDLVIAGRQGFQRLYDLPERVIPRALLDAPVPSGLERLRALGPEGRRRPRRPDRGWDRRALAAHGRRRAHPARRRRAWWQTASSSASRLRTAAATSSSSRGPTSSRRARRRRYCCRRSTTSSGTGRSRGACSASTT